MEAATAEVASTPDVSPEASGAEGSVADQKQVPLTQEEMEEIALGSVKGKVPKQLAKAIKDYERGIQGKFQETAKMRKEAEELLKADEMELIKRKGKDPYEWAEELIARKIEELSMSPEQRRAAEAEKRLAEYEERERLQREEMERQEYSRREQTYMQQLDTEIAEAFKESGLPKHQFYVQQMAAEMLSASKRGEELSAKEAAAKVKGRTNGHIKELIGQLSPESVEELLGPEILKKIREYEVKKVTANAAPTLDSGKRPTSQEAATSKAKSNSKPMSEREYRQWMESLKD